MDHELSHLICPEFTKTLVNIFCLNIYLPFRLSGGGLKSGTFETMANVGCDTACVFVGKKKKTKDKTNSLLSWWMDGPEETQDHLVVCKGYSELWQGLSPMTPKNTVKYFRTKEQTPEEAGIEEGSRRAVQPYPV